MQWSLLDRYPDPELERRWLHFLTKSDYPSHYLGPAYFREPFVTESRPFAILAINDSEVVGVLTGVRERGRLAAGLNVRPQASCRSDTDRTQVGLALAAGLREAAARDTDLVEVFTWTPIEGLAAAGYTHREFCGDRGVVVLDLRQGPDAVFRGFSANRRTNIHKAIKLGVAVDQASSEADFREYYSIYVDWCSRKRLPQNSWPQVLSALSIQDHRRLFVARYAGKMVAGVIVRFHSDGFLEYAANSSLQADQKCKPNDLLHWRVIEWACREGLSHYNLGGAHLFLRKFGGALHTTYGYRRDLTWLRRHDATDHILAVLRKVVRRLPEPVRQRLRSALGRGE